MKTPYDDIISLPHHVSRVHPQMPMYSRAAQFAPFAALSGHEAAISETARQTDTERELADSEAEMLDRKFAVLLQKKEEQPEVTITYFVPDKKKNGGSYHTSTGHIRKIDPDKDVIELTDGTSIPIVPIKNIDCDYFEY